MQNGSALVIGIDFGSDSVRAVVVRAADGKVLNESAAAYPRWREGRYSDAAKHQFRQHPSDYLEAMTAAVHGALQDQEAAKVVGIGVDTTGSTPCAVDGAGHPLALDPAFADDPDAMFILWKDHTALAEAEAITQAAHAAPVDYTGYCGGTYSPEWFWAKMLHAFKHDPKVAAAAASWVEHCDWIAGELCGNTALATLSRSRCAAGHKAMWHASWGGFPPESFWAQLDPHAVAIRRTLPAETRPAGLCAGYLSERWQQIFGLPGKVAVATAALDGHLGAVGAGITPGEMVKVMGTSTSDMVIAPTVGHRVPGICGQVDGSIVPGFTGLEAGQSAFGDVYAWFRRLLEYGGGKVALPNLEAEARLLAPGAGGTLALDWHNGRRTPDADLALTGAIYGLTLGTTAPMIYRALVEATAFGARRIIDRFVEQGIPVERISATGGIARKSPLVMQICADAFNRPIGVVKGDQVCALGAAMCAAAAAGCYASLPEAMQAMKPGCEKIYRPEAAAVTAYAALYQDYLRAAGLEERRSRRA